MISARQIIDNLYQSAEVSDCLKKVQPAHIRDDLKQHVFLILLEKPEPEIVDLYCRGKIKAFIAKIIYNTLRFKETKWTKEVGNLVLVESFEDRPVITEEEVQVPIDKLPFYPAEILKLYAQHGTYKRVSEVTRIPVTSIYETVIKARKQIKKLIYD